ncbi:hypothetical protein [Aeromicrobium sp.]|uniref:hypothetical protein n=1 Tax=Aeromicrobium sp. TaxID=1871063 RepID=UPI002FCA6B6F
MQTHEGHDGADSYPAKRPLRGTILVWLSLLAIVGAMAIAAALVMAWLIVGTSVD